MEENRKPGMSNIDKSQPLIQGGKVQLRLVTLMCHPDYNLDKAFNGKGEIGFNRNEELDEMKFVDILIDAKRRLEEEIDRGEKHYVTSYAYAGFMTDSWQRAIEQGIVTDPDYNREDYIDRSSLYNGRVALTLRRARERRNKE